MSAYGTYTAAAQLYAVNKCCPDEIKNDPTVLAALEEEGVDSVRYKVAVKAAGLAVFHSIQTRERKAADLFSTALDYERWAEVEGDLAEAAAEEAYKLNAEEAATALKEAVHVRVQETNTKARLANLRHKCRVLRALERSLPSCPRWSRWREQRRRTRMPKSGVANPEAGRITPPTRLRSFLKGQRGEQAGLSPVAEECVMEVEAGVEGTGAGTGPGPVKGRPLPFPRGRGATAASPESPPPALSPQTPLTRESSVIVHHAEGESQSTTSSTLAPLGLSSGEEDGPMDLSTTGRPSAPVKMKKAMKPSHVKKLTFP